MKKLSNRLFFQLALLVGLNLYFFRARSVCVPVLNCHSCPAAVFACPLGVISNFSRLRLFPFLAVGLVGLAAVIAGRLVCGWACPFGLFQDLLGRLRGRRRRWKPPPASALTKYFVLLFLVLLVPLLFPQSRLSFCTVCPAATLQASIPWRLMGVAGGGHAAFAARLGVLGGVIVLAVAAGRGFCRLLCPLGALLSLFNRFSFFRMRRAGPCNRCGACARRCPVDIDPVADMNRAECIRCLECTRRSCLRFGLSR